MVPTLNIQNIIDGVWQFAEPLFEAFLPWAYLVIGFGIAVLFGRFIIDYFEERTDSTVESDAEFEGPVHIDYETGEIKHIDNEQKPVHIDYETGEIKHSSTSSHIIKKFEK